MKGVKGVKNEAFPVVLTSITGSGKSALINYMLGNKMLLKPAKGMFDQPTIDVAVGCSNPLIGHSVSSVTTQITEYSDKDTGISWWDSPGFGCSRLRANEDMKIIAQSIEQFAKSKSVVIVLVDGQSLNMRYSVDSLLKNLLWLCNNTSIMSRDVLFALTKIPSPLSTEELIELVASFASMQPDLPLLTKMKRTENWTCVNMLDNNSRVAILSQVHEIAAKQSQPSMMQLLCDSKLGKFNSLPEENNPRIIASENEKQETIAP